MEQKSLKALVIDDDPIITKVVSRILVKRLQMEVREANSAKDALSLVENEIPDLIIVDYMMPIMTGKDFITLLKADEKFKNIPIIVLSALSDPEIIKDIGLLKVDDYILKPVTPQLIHERVVKVLKSHREKKESVDVVTRSEKSLIYIGNNKSLYTELLNIISVYFEIVDFENIPHKAFNLFLQKLHKIVIIEKQSDDIISKLIIEKIKDADPNTIIIYLVDDFATLMTSNNKISQMVNEIVEINVNHHKLADTVKKYLPN